MSLNPLERKAALALFPYFSKKPIIFDVGSNKGFWADLLIDNASEMHLFEPNGRLLTYTMVKYDHRDNVKYNPVALFSENGEREFFFFTNTNNGLSSVYKNQIWLDMGLPMQFGKCTTMTLDSYCEMMGVKKIDLLKIDVEGADFDVLLGAKKMLLKKAIKIIQIEKSDHLLLSGHTWEDVINFVQGHGYLVYDFDGTKFFKPEEWNAENYYIMDAEITQDWNSEFIKNTEFLKKKLEFVLEIGCFEGLTTRYICDELLQEGGRMIAIDPLTDEYLTTNDETAKSINAECVGMFTGQYDRFVRNTKGYPVELIRKTSREVMRDEIFKHYRFNLIYVDGDHRGGEVYNDGVMSFELCRKGGYILFDDYGWRKDTADGIDRFLTEYEPCIEVVFKSYQVLVKKTENLA